MKLGIIGYGVVGKAAALTFENVFDIIKYDKYQNLDTFESLLDCSFVFIMVPTPFDCKANCVDDSAVKDNLEKLSNFSYSGPVIIKSTVPPGSCNYYSNEYNLDLVFNPEFLRESATPNEDFMNQDTVVIGTKKIEIYNLVKEMYERVLKSNVNYFQTSFTEAEMIKCAQNTMLASRVALANMIFDACEAHNVEYDNLRKIAFDRFDVLGPHMVQVPGPDGNRGFGGKCLPKDIRAFQTIYNSDLLRSIIAYNDSLRTDMFKYLKNYDDDEEIS